MSRKRYAPEQIIGKLREAEVLLGKGQTVGQVCRKLGVTEQTYYRWRKEYGGMRVEQARRIRSGGVLYRLSELFATRGVPQHIRSDNEGGFTARAVSSISLAASVSITTRMRSPFGGMAGTTRSVSSGVLHSSHWVPALRGTITVREAR